VDLRDLGVNAKLLSQAGDQLFFRNSLRGFLDHEISLNLAANAGILSDHCPLALAIGKPSICGSAGPPEFVNRGCVARVGFEPQARLLATGFKSCESAITYSYQTIQASIYWPSGRQGIASAGLLSTRRAPIFAAAQQNPYAF